MSNTVTVHGGQPLDAEVLYSEVSAARSFGLVKSPYRRVAGRNPARIYGL